jgi:oligopeptidase A
MSNPLLESSSLPLFDRIQPADVAPAIDTLLARASEALETVVAPDFPHSGKPSLPCWTWRPKSWHRLVGHQPPQQRGRHPELRAAYNEALPKVTEFWTNLGADERLYAKYKAIDPASLNKEQRAAWDHAMRGFVLSGAELQGAAKERFAQIQAARPSWPRNSARTRWTPPMPLPTTPGLTSWTAFRPM